MVFGAAKSISIGGFCAPVFTAFAESADKGHERNFRRQNAVCYGYQHGFRSDDYSFKRYKSGRAEVVMLGYSFIVRKPEQTPLQLRSCTTSRCSDFVLKSYIGQSALAGAGSQETHLPFSASLNAACSHVTFTRAGRNNHPPSPWKRRSPDKP